MNDVHLAYLQSIDARLSRIETAFGDERVASAKVSAKVAAIISGVTLVFSTALAVVL